MALANHLVMGPAILARGPGGRAPYAVKIHGSALEYTVRPHRERFLPYALEGGRAARRGAGGVAAHRPRASGRCWPTSRRCRERTRLGPPGVDVHTFRPRRAADLERLAERVRSGDTASWGGEAGRRRGAALRSTPRATGS